MNRVFISHSDSCPEARDITRFFRQGLADSGLCPVLVEDRPSLGMSPEDKVRHYMQECDVGLALATEDPERPGQTRQNIIEEIGRLNTVLPKRYVVFVARGVGMPSNVSVTWHDLQADDLEHCLAMALEEFAAMGLPCDRRTASSNVVTTETFANVAVGDWGWAEKKAWEAVQDDPTGRQLARRCLQVMEDPSVAWDTRSVAGLALEALVELSPEAIADAELRRLAFGAEMELRSTAAACLQYLSQSAPHRVPADLLTRLASPREDYYVNGSALAALKYTARTRPLLLDILKPWLKSGDQWEAEWAARAVADVAEVDPHLVTPEIISLCKRSRDETARAYGERAEASLEASKGTRRGGKYWAF